MSKALKRLSLAFVAVSLCAAAASAQTTLEWIVLSLKGEEFTARMPKQPAASAQRLTAGGMSVAGTLYAADDEARTTYAVWSLQNSEGADTSRYGAFAQSVYLDQVAELAWELLVTPELERVKREETDEGARVRAAANVGMTYVRDFVIGGKAAREYTLRHQKEGGHVYVCADGARVYIVAAHGAAENAARLRQFVDSFAFKATPPSGSGTGTGSGRGGGVGGTGQFRDPNAPVDYDRPFRQNEVTQKARITFKPEPGFTESARKFTVTGVVRLRAILSKTGEMTNISVVKGLPHGLTESSIEATRRIRFEPAQKDGRPVAQYVVLEYNYNIY